MAKDYAKFIPPKSKTFKKSKGWLAFLLVSIFIVLLTTAGATVFYFRQPLLLKFSSLINHKKPVVEVASGATKTVAESTEPDIHFDFYDELPNMQVGDAASLALSAPSSEKKSEPTPAPSPDTAAVVTTTVNNNPDLPSAETAINMTKAEEITSTDDKPVIAENASLDPSGDVVKAKDPAPAEEQTIAKSKSVSAPSVGADDVSDLLADVQNAPRYVIDLGVFDTIEAARILQQAIVAVGFDPQIVKIKQGNRKLYQLQQGPYENIALAKQSQQRLAKRGIICALQKVPT